MQLIVSAGSDVKMTIFHSNDISWSKKWQEVEGHVVVSGAQASSKVVIERADGVEKRFLKILNRQENAERRYRLYSEAVSLEQLTLSSVPKILETNARNYADKNFKLYIITEYIDGKTLSELCDAGLSAIEAVRIAVQLCKIVNECHGLVVPVIHRDIKPDNIMIDSDGNLFLVDFGMCFRDDPNRDHQTLLKNIIGNRFLALPEHGAYSLNKQDARSDITACVGILFYCLTNEWPALLLDHDKNMPHQRQSARSKLNNIENLPIRGIFEIFDRGFNYDISRRFQSAEALISEMSRVVRTEAPDAPTDPLAVLERYASQSPVKAETEAREALETLIHQTQAEIYNAIRKLGRTFDGTQEMWSIDYPSLTGSYRFSIFPSQNRSKHFGAIMNIMIVGTEYLIFAAGEDGRDYNVARIPTADGAKIRNGDRDRISEILIEGLSRNLI